MAKPDPLVCTHDRVFLNQQELEDDELDIIVEMQSAGKCLFCSAAYNDEYTRRLQIRREAPEPYPASP